MIAESKKNAAACLDEINARKSLWEERVNLAIDKGRDDLAREALIEKKRFGQMAEAMEGNLAQQTILVTQYRDDIAQLEDKLGKAREKQHVLIQRAIHAKRAKQTQEDIRRIDNYEAIARFEDMESRIDRMEAEAELVNPVSGGRLEDAFHKLHVDDDIEKELSAIKAQKKSKPSDSEQTEK